MLGQSGMLHLMRPIGSDFDLTVKRNDLTIIYNNTVVQVMLEQI